MLQVCTPSDQFFMLQREETTGIYSFQVTHYLAETTLLAVVVINKGISIQIDSLANVSCIFFSGTETRSIILRYRHNGRHLAMIQSE